MDPACDTCRDRKVRCGREKPRCSACRKCCLDCGYPTAVRGKPKYSKAIPLNKHRVSKGLGSNDRLAHIEKSIALLIGAAGLDARNGDGDVEVSTDSPPPNSYCVGSASNGLVVRFDDGSSQFHGACSLLGLCHNTRLFLEGAELQFGPGTVTDVALQTETATCGATILTLERWLVKTSMASIEADAADLSAIKMPDRSLLDHAINIYFGDPNISDHLFEVEEIHSLIETAYSTISSPTCLATVVCFRYLIAQTCSVELHNSSQDDNVSQDAHSDDVEIFLKAGKTLLRHVSEAKLYLLDVQSFACVALAAVDRGDIGLYHAALAEACRLAKQIGMHQGGPAVEGDTSFHQRLVVFWNLYALEKAGLFSTGQSCLLPSSDCGAPFPSQINDDTITHALLLAGIQLANIQEDIYHSLYSIEAQRKSAQGRRQEVARISMRLQGWRTQHDAALRRGPSVSKSNMHRHSELHLACILCDILVQQRSLQSRDDHNTLLNTCREHLRLVETLVAGGDDPSADRMCYRSLHQLPAVSIFQIYRAVLSGRQNSIDQQRDILLLRSLEAFFERHERSLRLPQGLSRMGRAVMTMSQLVSRSQELSLCQQPQELDSSFFGTVQPSSLSHISGSQSLSGTGSSSLTQTKWNAIPNGSNCSDNAWESVSHNFDYFAENQDFHQNVFLADMPEEHTEPLVAQGPGLNHTGQQTYSLLQNEPLFFTDLEGTESMQTMPDPAYDSLRANTFSDDLAFFNGYVEGQGAGI